ncbi:amidohydrolase family protein [Myxococcota bacterium]|nr:amidohydrolase family protein [Myxococcota bacterium]
MRLVTTSPAALLALLLVACPGKDNITVLDDTGGDGGAQDGGTPDGGTADGGTGGDGGGGDGGGGDGGGGDGGTPFPDELVWTEGPALPDCTPTTDASDRVALSGVVLTPGGPVAGHVVYDRGTGEIACAGEACSTAGATVVCTEGVISAGLIDAHNHLQYNVIPPWQHDALFEDRYDWRSDDAYWDYREAYDDIEDDYTCEIMRWAELRVLVGGGTAAVGSSGDSCIEGLVRNLDEDEGAHELDGYELYYSSGTVTDSYEDGDGDYYQGQLSSGAVDAILNHVAEGVDGSGEGELSWMLSVEMTGPGMAYVHATDATTEQLARMAVDGTSIVWSPRSNLDLYAQTTPADIAARMGVPVALGPDWTWSGSMNPAHEAACAVEYLGARGNPLSDVDLHDMITAQAARVVGLDGVLGALDEGMRADISVFAWSDQPYRAVLQSGAEDVRLVVVDGQALYGVSELVADAADSTADCETVEACTASRTLCAVSGSSGAAGMTAEELADTLAAALGRTDMPADLAYAGELHGLWDCEDSFSSCDPREGAGTAADADGDGVDDTVDLCEGWYDPRQADHDGDGWGDACDPCPLAADVTDCRHDPADIDGDGVANGADLCPWLHDDQGDRDADGHGDVCDICPDEYNPGDSACSATVDMVRNPDHEGYVGEGAVVTLEGLVVTAVSSSGYFAQDPSLSAWAGIYVYSGGSPGVDTGDVVTVTGTVTEYYGLTELTDPESTVTGSASAPAPVALANPCDAGDDGARGEELEGMLVQVEDVTVSSQNPDSPSDYGEFEVAGCLRVNDFLYDFGSQPAVGAEYDRLAGVLNYSYSHRKLEPRSAGDLEAAR